MGENAEDNEFFQEIFGTMPSALTSEWLSANSRLSPQLWNQFLNRNNGNVRYLKDDKNHPGKIFAIIDEDDDNDGHGLHRGYWLDPNDPFDLAMLNEDYAGALEIVDSRIAADADDADDIARDRISALMCLRRFDEALVEVDAYLERHPDDADFISAKGALLSAQGHPEEALAYFQRAAELEPDNPSFQWWLANTYLELGDRDRYLQITEASFHAVANSTDPRLRFIDHNVRELMNWHTDADFERSKQAFLAGVERIEPAPPLEQNNAVSDVSTSQPKAQQGFTPPR
jgi:tetratricopeptide (TPR) repeat protein